MKRIPFVLSDAQISAIRRDYDAGTVHREQALLAAQIPSTKATQALKAAGIERWHSTETIRKNLDTSGQSIGARIKSALETIQRAFYGYTPTLPEHHAEPPPPQHEVREHPYPRRIFTGRPILQRPGCSRSRKQHPDLLRRRHAPHPTGTRHPRASQ